MTMKMTKSKTMWFAVALAVMGVLEQSTGVIKQMVGEANFGLVMLLISVGVAVLRILTTMPLEDK